MDQSMILGLLEQQIGSRNLQHWFTGKTIFTFDGEELVVGVANPFLLDWMQKRFRGELAEIARSLRGPAARVRFEIDGRIATLTDEQVSATSKAPLETEESAVQTPPTQSSPTRPSQATQPREAVEATRMGRRFADLADFVCGTSNELALTAAKQVCAAPGTRFNPLFVHGGVDNSRR